MQWGKFLQYLIADFLDKAKDINRFAKLAETYTKFFIEYLNYKGAISYYYPDFISEQKLSDGTKIMWLIETKGWEKAEVKLKDERAEEWCKDASRLTGIKWKYLKVKYDDYIYLTDNLSKFPADNFAEFYKIIRKLDNPGQIKFDK